MLVIDAIEDLGIPVGDLEGGHDSVLYSDDLGSANLHGQHVSMLRGDDGVYYPPGFRHVRGLYFTYNAVYGVIVVTHDVALAMKNKQITTGTGRLTSEAGAVFHEFLHAVIYNNEINIGEADEETIAHDMEAVVLPKAMEALAMLNQTEELTHLQKYQLRSLLRALKNKLAELRQINPAAFDAILAALGWEDLDGNGFPDFIDDAMNLRGLDFEHLPTMPHPPERCTEPSEELVPGQPETRQRLKSMNLYFGGHSSHLITIVITPCGDYYIECACGGVFTNLD